MQYSLNARLLDDLKVSSRRLSSRPLFRAVWCVLLPPIGVLCYAGCGLAVCYVLVLPLEILGWLGVTPHTKLISITIIITALASIGICSILGITIYRRLRARKVDIDLITKFAGAALAAWYAAMNRLRF